MPPASPGSAGLFLSKRQDNSLFWNDLLLGQDSQGKSQGQYAQQEGLAWEATPMENSSLGSFILKTRDSKLI